MRFKGIAWGILLLAVIFGVSACGGGGGSGGGSKKIGLGGTGFGFFDTFGNTTAPPSSGDFPKLWGVNLPIILYFNDNIDPASCSNLSINLVTIDDPTGQASYGAGHSATVDYVVNGKQLWITPRIFFSQTDVSFGFLEDAVYEIGFQVPPSPYVVKSLSGEAITLKETGKPVAFRTPALDDPDGFIYDDTPGPPEPIRFALFDKQENEIAVWIEGSWYVQGQVVPKVEIDPMEPPIVRVDFSEPVQPQSVVNFADKSSPSLSVYFNQDGVPWDPVRSLGAWELTQSKDAFGNFESYAEFTPDLIALKDDSEYFIRVKGTVDDLAGNRKGYNVSDEVSFFTVLSTDPLPDLIEEFNNTAYEDPSTTSAQWSVDLDGSEFALVPGLGGGTGDDGPFLPPDDVPNGAVVDSNNLVVELPTSSSGELRVYNFTSFTLPSSWTIYPKEVGGVAKPLILKATGEVRIMGTIDIAPKDGTHHGTDGSYGWLLGTNGGAGICGGGDGGRGGALKYSLSGTNPPFLDDSGGQFEDSAANTGICGVNTAIQDYALQDSNKTQAFFQGLETILQAGDVPLLIQPNVGMGEGNSNVVSNHPAFFIESVIVSARVYNIVSNPADPRYRGSLLQESTNPGLPVPPIAKSGDPYIIGALEGFSGSDPTLSGREGLGGKALTVAQTVVTYASGGAGGGGAGVEDGMVGGTGPDFAPLGGAIGGFSNPWSPGGSSGVVSDLVGNVLGPDPGDPTVLWLSGTNLELSKFVGYFVNPNVLEEGWLFEIAENTADTITIVPFSNGVAPEAFDLDNVTFNGDEVFQIFTPLDLGGAGGGGSGVELTGTYKTVFEPPFQVPAWTAGAGGGAGGGVLMIETARNINVAGSGRVYARGGNGGTMSGIPLAIPGGGGGSGGTIHFRARSSVKLSEGSAVSVEGGLGGGVEVYGGTGGSGLIRFENLNNSLKASNFASTTFPPVDASNLGVFPAQEGSSLAMSKFYFMQVSRPDYIFDPFNTDPDHRGLKIVYDLTEVDEFNQETTYENLVYPDPDGQFSDPYLFRIAFNSCPSDTDGFLDLSKINNNFVPFEDFDTMDGQPYIRFVLQLHSSKEVDVGGEIFTYKSLKIRNISINRSQL